MSKKVGEMKNVAIRHNSEKLRILLLPIVIPLWLVGWVLYWTGIKDSARALPKRVFRHVSLNPKKRSLN